MSNKRDKNKPVYEIWARNSGMCTKWHAQTTSNNFVIFLIKLAWMKRKYKMIDVHYKKGYLKCDECWTEIVAKEMFSDEKINLN